HLNSKKTDGFVLALRDQRPDLSGLPFAMGDACRTKGERSKQFTLAVATVRRALPRSMGASPPVAGALIGTAAGASQPSVGASLPPPPPAASAENHTRGENFWEQYRKACDDEDRILSKIDRVQCEHVTLTRIAALMQVLAPEEPEMRLGLVKYLAG